MSGVSGVVWSSELLTHSGSTAVGSFYFDGDESRCVRCPDRGGGIGAISGAGCFLLALLSVLVWIQHRPKGSRFRKFGKLLNKLVRRVERFLNSGVGLKAKAKVRCAIA